MPNFNTIVDAAMHAVEQAELDGHLHGADAEVVEAAPDEVVDALDAAVHDGAAALQPNPLTDMVHAVRDFAHHSHDVLAENVQDGHEVHEGIVEADSSHDDGVHDAVADPGAADHHDPYDDGQ